VFKRFGMLDAKPVKTPLAAYFWLSAILSPQTDEEEKYMSRVLYVSAVESIMYAMVCTRPSIPHAISVMSRNMDKPRKGHWQAIKWILWYLKGSTSIGLCFDRKTNSDYKIAGYSDSDFAGNLDRRRSLTGYAFTLSDCVISWKVALQSTVALSTIEAEYIPVIETVKETIWLRGLVEDPGLHQGITTVFYDRQTAIHLTKHRCIMREPNKLMSGIISFEKLKTSKLIKFIL